MPGRAVERGRPAHARWADLRCGQSLVETALAVPVLLLLAFGVVAIGRVTHGQMAVGAVAREAARVATTTDTATEARARGIARGLEVAAGYGLANGSLEVRVEPGTFSRGGRVRGVARYQVSLGDLPLLGWARVPVAGDHVERVDLYRSRWRSENSR